MIVLLGYYFGVARGSIQRSWTKQSPDGELPESIKWFLAAITIWLWGLPVLWIRFPIWIRKWRLRRNYPNWAHR